MNKKRQIIIFIVIACVLLMSVLLMLKNRSQFKTFKKYSVDIDITLKSAEDTKNILITYKDDGLNARIDSSELVHDAYIHDDVLYYTTDAKTVYMYKLKRSYRDLNRLVAGLHGADKLMSNDSSSKYSKVLSVKETNDILDSLFFTSKTRTENLMELTILENRVKMCKFSVEDIPGYDNVTIVLRFNELDDSFEISEGLMYDSLDKNANLISRAKYVNTDENIFEIDGGAKNGE